MDSAQIAYLTIGEAAALLRKRQLSAAELAAACLERIEALDGKLNSFVTVTREVALAQAGQADNELSRGEDRGPLHGIPVAFKDLYATRSVRTTAHSRLLLDWLPEEDATAVARLREAGSVMLGKLAMHEFAFGAPGFDTAFPPARNPWNLECIPGGSSSGSAAALAAGLCYGALGSDTGGSIRGPAALCGIVGLKPTYGLVSRAGVVPLSWSLDHAGPMARTVSDCAILLQAIAGPDPRDPASAAVAPQRYDATLEDGVRGLRLGVPRSWLHEGDGTDAEVLAAFEEALRVLEKEGARLVEVDGAPFMASRGPNLLILIAEAYAYHEKSLRTRASEFSAGVRNRVREGAFISAADYIQAQRARTVLSRQIGAILREVDAIVSPSAPRPASTFAAFDPEANARRPSYTNPFNLAGLPAISIPCGFSSDGLPLGLQIGGRAFDEATVLRIARAYERVTPWHERHPDL